MFIDTDNIPPGLDFRDYISNAVAECAMVLAVIGKHWLTAANDAGERRLDDPADWVRLEIEAALQRSIPVIPVLVNEGRMPPGAELPGLLRSLVYRNATELCAVETYNNISRGWCAM